MDEFDEEATEIPEATRKYVPRGKSSRPIDEDISWKTIESESGDPEQSYEENEYLIGEDST